MDMHTLHVEHAALLGLFTLLTVVNSRMHRGARGSSWFPAFTFFAFAGALLIALRGLLPDWLSIWLGDLFFSVAYVFLHRSFTEFFGKRSSQWWFQLALAGVCAVTLWRWTMMTPDTQHRLFWYSLILCAQVGLSAALVLRNATGPLRWSAWMMGSLLVLLSVNSLLRALAVLRFGVPADYLKSQGTMCWTLLLTSVLQGAVTIAFVWMTAARLRAELEVEAMTDPLTRLLNRRALDYWAEREVLNSLASDLPLSAILIDLDEFKHVNDAWGHQCGDAVLLSVARCLEGEMRCDDRLARLGGDEFAVLLPRTSLYEAIDIAERLRCAVEETRCISGEMVMRVHASFGVAQMDEAVRGWVELLQQCDRAMYRVKARGGNQVLVH